MRAVCPSDAGPDIFVDFPAGSTSADLWRYGCRFATDNDQPTSQDFVATGVVNLDTPTLPDVPPTPRFAEPNPPSFVLDVVATTPPVVTAPRPVPRMAEPNPPSWISQVFDQVVEAVRPVPKLPPPPVVLDFGPRFTDTGITQTQPDYVPTTFVAPSIVTAPTVPRMAELNPPSFFADLGNVVATFTAAVVEAVRPVPRIAQPDPPSFTIAAQEPAPAAPVNRPKPASARTVCLKIPGGGYVSVPPEYRNGYDGEEVDYSLCLIQPDGIPATDILGPGGGSNPVEVPATDPTPTPDPILETFIPTGIVQPLIDSVVAFLQPRAPAPYQAVSFAPDPTVTPPSGEVIDETTSTPSAKPCSCHSRSGETRNWMLLLAAAALLYVLTRKSK